MKTVGGLLLVLCVVASILRADTRYTASEGRVFVFRQLGTGQMEVYEGGRLVASLNRDRSGIAGRYAGSTTSLATTCPGNKGSILLMIARGRAKLYIEKFQDDFGRCFLPSATYDSLTLSSNESQIQPENPPIGQLPSKGVFLPTGNAPTAPADVERNLDAIVNNLAFVRGGEESPIPYYSGTPTRNDLKACSTNLGSGLRCTAYLLKALSEHRFLEESRHLFTAASLTRPEPIQEMWDSIIAPQYVALRYQDLFVETKDSMWGVKVTFQRDGSISNIAFSELIQVSENMNVPLDPRFDQITKSFVMAFNNKDAPKLREILKTEAQDVAGYGIGTVFGPLQNCLGSKAAQSNHGNMQLITVPKVCSARDSPVVLIFAFNSTDGTLHRVEFFKHQ